MAASGGAGGGIAFVIGIIAQVFRRGPYGWSCLGIDLLVLAFFNSLVHARGGWTAVVLHGLILPALTALVIVAGGLRWHASSPSRRAS